MSKILGMFAKDEEKGYFDRMIGDYVSPKGYIEWDNYAKLCLVSGCMKAVVSCFGSGDAVGAVATTAVRSAIKNSAPARYLSKEIVESFAQTPLPELPLEACGVLPYVHLMLPRKTVFDCEGDEVISMIVYSGRIFHEHLDKDTELISKTFFPKEEIIPEKMLGADGIQIVTFTPGGMDVFQEFVSPNAKSWHDENVKYTGRSKYENEKTEALMRIAINSLLVHLYEPGLITTDSKAPTKAFGFLSGKKEPLPITWVGKLFKRSRATGDRVSSSHERSATRAHWRRGHWHTVLHGPKKQERRVQWFKPVYVKP